MRKLRKMLIITAAVCAALTGTGARAAENILVDGGFEGEFYGQGGWRFRDYGGWYAETGYPLLHERENAAEGESALHFMSATVAQRVALKRNVTYDLSFKIRAAENCRVYTSICNGAQDWPASYPVQDMRVEVTPEWTEYTTRFECTNTQDYLINFNLWDLVDVYIDDVVLKESESYVSRLVAGVNGKGEMSFKTDIHGEGALLTALYDEDGKLKATIPNREQGTFAALSEYGEYTLTSYLLNKNEVNPKTQTLIYDENSAKNENDSLGKLTSLKLSENALELEENGKKAVLDAQLLPRFAYNNAVIWDSSDTAVAAVTQNGVITPRTAGTAVIKASTADGRYSDECRVTVKEKAAVSGISLNKESIALREIDSVYPLKAEVVGTDKRVVWTSSDESVAAVTDGLVTARGAGVAEITAMSADGEHSAKCAVAVTTSSNTITNDRFYTDTDGNPIYSQGGCIRKFGDKYYWYGIQYAQAPIYAANPQDGKPNGVNFEAFTCYSSTDLVNWTFEGYPLTQKPQGWGGRMGVAYNANTKKYVLISQYAPGMLFAVSDTPEGPYTIDHIRRTLPIQNDVTGDQTIFQDEDGKAYIICSSANGRAYQYIIPLRDEDFLDIDVHNIRMIFHDSDGSYIDENGETAKKDKTGIEGNCMFKYNGRYYFTGSDLYGWNSSRVYVLESDSILGEYNPDTRLPYIMDGTRENYAHNSQAGFYYTIEGTDADLVMYCGDRWSNFAGNGEGYNQWVPISMDADGKPHFNNLHQWRLDAKKGSWEIGEGNNYIANPDFECDRKLTADPTGWAVSDTVGGYVNSNASGKQYSGNFVWRQSADEDYIAKLAQTVTGLEDGTYAMTAWVRASGGQSVCSLYAQTSERRYEKSVKTVGEDWTEIVVSDAIEVKDGKCEVGLYSDAHAGEWVEADNFRLVKICGQ